MAINQYNGFLSGMFGTRLPQPEKTNEPNWIYKDKDGNNKIDIIKLGNEIIKENEFVYITDGTKETLYRYLGNKKGYWDKTPVTYLNTLVADKLGKYWRPKLEKDTVQFINSHTKRIEAKNSIYQIPETNFNFKNGVFNWDAMELKPHNKKYHFTSVSGTNLNTQSLPTPVTDKWFKLTFGENAKTMMEFIGYIFYPSYSAIQAYIILLGSGNDGKSTFINKWLIPTVGRENTTSISIKDLTSKSASNFKISELHGKYLNAHSENSESTINDTATLKMLTGGDSINADVKGQNDINFINIAKMIFATNNLPPFRDNSKGMYRRPFIIRFNRIPDFQNIIDWQQIESEKSAFIYKCILLAKEAIKKKSLTETPSILKDRAEWLGTNSPIATFLDECTKVAPDNEQDAIQLYNAYCNWCELNGNNYPSRSKFWQELKNNFDIPHYFHKPHGGKREYYLPDITIIGSISTIHPQDKPK